MLFNVFFPIHFDLNFLSNKPSQKAKMYFKFVSNIVFIIT